MTVIVHTNLGQMSSLLISETQECELDTLHPEVRERAVRHIAALEKEGFEIVVIVAWESIGQRAELYTRGRSRNGSKWHVTDRALVATRSEIGWHPFGLAYDLTLTLGNRPPSPAAWVRVGELGETAGLSWCTGNRRRSGNHRRWSPVSHFQHVPQNIYPSDIRRIITHAGPNLKDLPEVWAMLDKRFNLA